MKKIEKKAAWVIQSAGETTGNNLAEYSQKGRRLVEIYLSFVHHHKDDFELADSRKFVKINPREIYIWPIREN